VLAEWIFGEHRFYDALWQVDITHCESEMKKDFYEGLSNKQTGGDLYGKTLYFYSRHYCVCLV